MAIDLSSLPTPQVIEEVSYEAIVARKKAKFQELWEAVRAANPTLNLPAYDISMLETDPVVIVIEADAYDEMLLRARVNDAVRSNLLAYATGANLDNLAADHGVTRLTGESDQALRERIVLRDQGSSSAGPEEWYEYHARSASVLVKDVSVYRGGTGPEITVAVLATNNGGVPDQSLLDAVYAVVNSPSIRVVNDVISVIPATGTTFNVVAQIWLLPDTPSLVFEGLEASLRAAFTAEGGIGFDINVSWLISKLMVSGVSKVVVGSPVTDIVISGNMAATLDQVTLTYAGRSR